MVNTAPVILVVEDEPLLRIDTVDMVEDEGFRTLEASNSRAALAMLEQHPEISVLCTDIDMPGEMDGLVLAQEVRRRWPEIAIVVVSGYRRPADGELPDPGRFVPKPYVKAAIIQALKDMIGVVPRAS